MKVDCIVVGQGLCGSFLSWNLWKAGLKVVVIDESRPNSSSKVASGVINPITGRRLVKTWMADELLLTARQEYAAFGKELGKQLYRDVEILLFHTTPQMRDAFTERFAEDTEYLRGKDASAWNEFFNIHYGVAAITPALQVEIQGMLHGWRDRLREMNMLNEQQFEVGLLQQHDTHVHYDGIDADRIIFCNGTDAFQLPFFEKLPFARNKGQALIAEIPGLPSNDIYKHSFTVTPWTEGKFWIGSTYEWNYDTVAPTEIFRRKAEEHLRHWLRIPFTIVDQIAAERPATVERRPFVGMHPQHPRIGILDGTGTKGCSLAPYFAKQFTAHLLRGEAITPQADVRRFSRILGNYTN